MCGRFEIHIQLSDVERFFNVSAVTCDWSPRYNVGPTQSIYAIIDVKGERRLGHLSWGLVPQWADSTKDAARCINARSETVAEKPSFREAYKSRRCLIPANGFYEWPADKPKSMPPWLIRPEGHELFAFAGIWETWTSPEGQKHHSCAILTREAVGDIADIHHRMPIMLDPQAYQGWLCPTTSPKEVTALLDKHTLLQTTHKTVTKQVNKVSFDCPECLEPENKPTQKELF